MEGFAAIVPFASADVIFFVQMLIAFFKCECMCVCACTCVLQGGGGGMRKKIKLLFYYALPWLDLSTSVSICFLVLLL